MKKHWTFGLILLVALAGCGDKKADQAKALQQELQDLLAKTELGGQKLSYGDVTVTPDGDVFDASIDKLGLTIPDAAPVDLGKVTFKIAPDGDDMRKFSDVVLPTSIAFKATDGTGLANLTLDLDHANGSWSKKIGVIVGADVLFKSIAATQPSSGDVVTGTAVGYQLTSTDGGQNGWDLNANLAAKQIALTSKDGQASISDFSITSNDSGAKLIELTAMRDDWKKAAASGKADQIVPLFGKMLSLIKTMKFAVALGKTSVSQGTQTLFSLGSLNFDFGLDGLDQPKAKLLSGLKYAGLFIPDLKTMIGPSGADLVPTDFGFKYGADDVPLANAIDLAGKDLANVNAADQTALVGAGMAMAGVMDQAFAQAGTKIFVSDGAVTAPAFTAKFDGQSQMAQGAAMGGSGTLNLQVSDIDAIITRLSQYTDDPQKDQIVSSLQMLKQLSDPGTDEAGKKIDRFKVTLDQEGKTLVNGKPLPTN
jgi:hypothetical protein